MARFDVTQITVNATGPQPFTADAHLTSRGNRKPAEMIAVTVGNMLIQVHDLPAARSFATACRSALGFVPAAFPAHADGPDAVGTRRCPGVLLQVEGAPAICRIHGFGAAFGTPHVRVHIDRLIVRFFDLDALQSWADGWGEVEQLAQRIWAAPDAIERAEARERLRIAKTRRTTAASG
jgi:hypothetical protein